LTQGSPVKSRIERRPMIAVRGASWPLAATDAASAPIVPARNDRRSITDARR
jgi:hypothetical protein